MMRAATKLDGGLRPPGSARLKRDLIMSGLAGTVAALAVLHIAQAPLPDAPPSAGKSAERLNWTEEDVPTRVTGTFDTLAMFALPQVEPSPWSEPGRAAPQVAEAPEAASPLPPHLPAAAGGGARRLALVLPPSRPPSAIPATAPRPTATAVDRPDATERRRISLLGWDVPGTDLLPGGRDAEAALHRVTSLGGAVMDLGDALADRVGLK